MREFSTRAFRGLKGMTTRSKKTLKDLGQRRKKKLSRGKYDSLKL